MNSEIDTAVKGTPLCVLRVAQLIECSTWQDASLLSYWELCAYSNTNHQENGDEEPGLILMGALGRRPKPMLEGLSWAAWWNALVFF